MLGLGGGHMRFGHKDGLPSGGPKPSWLIHHFEELSWTLLPNHRFKAILVYVGGLD